MQRAGRLKKRAIFILLAIALLVGGLNLFTRGRYFSGKIKTYVVEQAGRELGMKVGMGRLVFNFFPAYIDIEKPAVSGWDPKNPARAIGARKIRAYISIGSLLNRRINIRRIIVYGASLDVERFPDGSFDIDHLRDKISELLKKKPERGAYKVEVHEIVLLGACGSYSDAAKKIFVSVSDAGVDFRINGRQAVGGVGRSRPAGSTGYWAGFKLNGISVKLEGRPSIPASLEGDAEYADGRINFRGVRFDSSGARLKLSGYVLPAGKPELDLKFSSSADLSLLGRLGLMKEPPEGLASLSGSLRGTYPSLFGTGEFSLRKGAYRGVRIDDIYSRVIFDKGMLSMPELESRLFGGRIKGNVLVDFSGGRPSFRSQWNLKGLVSGDYTASNPKLRFIPWYTVNGDVKISGTGLNSLEITASGDVSATKYERPHSKRGVSEELDMLKQAKVVFRMGGGLIQIDKGYAWSKNTAISFAGVVGFDGASDMSIKAHSNDITDISTLIGYSDVHGKLDLGAYMRGNILRPTITGKAKITDAFAHGVSFPEAKGDVKLSDWQLSFSNFMVRHKTGSFVIDGTVFFDSNGGTVDNPYFDARLSIRKVNARGIIAIFYKDIPVNLTTEGVMNFSGTTSRFKGDARLTTGAGDVYGQPLDKGFVTARLTEKGISFPKVIAVAGHDVVTASGAIGFDNTFQGKASSARFSLTGLKVLSDTGAPVKGSASFSVTGKGTFDNPSIEADLSTLKLGFGGVDLGHGNLRARLRRNNLRLDGTVLGRKVSLAGTLGLSKPYKWNGSLVFNGGRLEPFIRLVYKELPEGASLVSTGVITGNGELSDPSVTSVQLDLKEVDALVFDRKLSNVGDIQVAYSDGKLDLKSFNMRGDNLSLSASGVAAGMDNVDAKIRVDASLDAFKPLLKGDVDYISGRGQADIRVKGGLKNPAVSGVVRVTGGGLKVRDLPQRFDKINAEALIEGSGFRLTKFGADFGGGTISAKGDGAIKDWRIDNFGFDITANGIGVKTIDGLTPVIDASVRFEGVGGTMNAAGNVSVRKARYAKRIDWKSWLVEIRRKRNLPAPSASGGFKDILLDLHVTAADTIEIDNNVAKVPASADVYVRGTVGRPVLIGRLEAGRGKVYFRSNEFTLKNAVMEFADPNKFNPLIDLTAETTVKDYTITMTLTGTLDRVKIDLVSDPPLEEGDVITLLALGRTSDELKGHEAAITTGEAAGFVTGQIQDAVESRVKMITGFDRFQIDPYMTSSGVSSGPRLTVGKSLFSDKLYLTYSSNIGTTEDQYVKLEYIFNRNLSLVGERDELGHYGGDLKFRFEFK